MWPPPLRLASPLRSQSLDSPDAPAAPPAHGPPPDASSGVVERASKPLFRLVADKASLTVPGQSPADAYAPFSAPGEKPSLSSGPLSIAQGVSPAGLEALAKMRAASPWDYRAMREALLAAPAGDRAAVCADFERGFRDKLHIPASAPHPPFFVLLEQHARGSLTEPTTDASRQALASRLCHPTPSSLDELPPRPLEALERSLLAAQGTIEQQRSLADKLEGARDPRAVFTRVYQHVSEQIVLHASVKGLRSPWLELNCVVEFSRLYTDALSADDARQRDRSAPGPRPHWAEAFSQIRKATAEDQASGKAMAYLFDALLPAIQAHVTVDLAKGVAAAYQRLYPTPEARAKAPLPSFEADFMRMGDRGGVFDRAEAAFLHSDARRVAGFGGALAEGIPQALRELALKYPLSNKDTIGSLYEALPALPRVLSLPSGRFPPFEMQAARKAAWDEAVRRASK